MSTRTFHGLLDDTLDVYHEDKDGNVWINTTYIDMILDFLLYVGVKPWIEFSFTPGILAEHQKNDYPFGGVYTLLPKDLVKWQRMIEMLMRHFIERYGVETVCA